MAGKVVKLLDLVTAPADKHSLLQRWSREIGAFGGFGWSEKPHRSLTATDPLLNFSAEILFTPTS